MPWCSRSALVCLACLAATPLLARGAGPLASALTGIALPAGTKAEGGFLNRAAARADLELTAEGAGASLAQDYEVFHLGPVDGRTATLAAVRSMAESQGWTFVPAPAGASWGWLDRGRTRVLLQLTSGADGAWLYLAEVAGRPAGPGADISPPPASATAPTPAAPPAPALPAGLPAGRRFQFTSTTFDDGWVAEEAPDLVRVRKGPLTVLLFHRLAMTDEMRPPVRSTTDYFWARDVAPRFDVRTTDDRRRELQFSGVDYREGEAVDRSTGRPAFVGMNVTRSNGVAANVVVVAPDRATFYRAFPRPEDLAGLLRYNMFAVGPGDLPGAWAERGGAHAQMYEVQTGNYAGMSAAVASAQFFIEADGTYWSLHKGATGMVGSMRTFQQEYRGRWRLDGNWELTLTDRAEGRADTFLVQFEAVRGGRLLHLTDKAHPGMQYTLAPAP